jgi:hypothetical protein
VCNGRPAAFQPASPDRPPSQQPPLTHPHTGAPAIWWPPRQTCAGSARWAKQWPRSTDTTAPAQLTPPPPPRRVCFAQLQPGNAASSSVLAAIIEARSRGYASSTVDEDELSSGEDESEEEDEGRLTVVGGSQQECEQPELSFTME